MTDTRPLPRLDLPVAYLRSWPDATHGGRRFVESMDLWSRRQGLQRLGEGLFCLWPTAGRADVIDEAVLLARALHGHAGGTEGGAAEDLPAVLIFPGRARIHGNAAEPIADVLFDDLEQKRASLPRGRILVTGYAASWIAGRFQLIDAGAYEGPSGRRVPLLTVESERHPGRPWHNPRLFGRDLSLPRPRVAERLEQALTARTLGLEGALGVGKTYAIWHALGEGPRVWVHANRNPGGLLTTLDRRLDGLAPAATGADVDPSAPPEDQTSALIAKLKHCARYLGAPPTLVIEAAESTAGGDRSLLEALMRRLHGANGDAPSRLILVDRHLSASWDTLSTRVWTPAFDAAESAAFSGKLLKGLEMHDDVAERLLAAAAGHPLALEESLVAMVHRGLLRRVYGSFFFAGDRDSEWTPSLRLVRQVEAAVATAGEPLPLRILSTAEESIDAAHLGSACSDFGVELPVLWHRSWVDAGWLAESDGRLTFACPAYSAALRATLGRDAARALRHSLGGVLASSGSEWTAYRLMAGSPEALPSLLDSSRQHSETGAPREELFNALWTEHRELRERGGDEATELEILWALLPLARRLGCLGRLQQEMGRAVVLARGDDQRYVALVALKAEHDQEQGNFRDAEAGLREALTASEGTDEKRRATLFLRLGALLHRQQRWAEARDLFRSLASVADQQGESALGATCRFYLGNLALQQRRLDDAEKYQRQSLDYRLGHGLYKAAGASLCALGAISLARGDYPHSLEHFEKAEKVLEKGGADAWDISYAQLGTGRARLRLGDFTGGIAQLKQALESRRGRDDVVGEALTHLELALGRLLLDQNGEAQKEARRAHFHLSLVPEGSFLGDAERLLGRIALRHGELKAADEHFSQALRLHRRYSDDHDVAEDASWQLERALAGDDEAAVERTVLELVRILDALPQPDGGEALFYRLYLGLRRLRDNELDRGDPEKPLRRAYKELMRKTGFLPAARRQAFLYQVRVHQDILNAATEYQISLPYVPLVQPPVH